VAIATLITVLLRLWVKHFLMRTLCSPSAFSRQARSIQSGTLLF
jgi:hypothetical protein